MNQYLRRLTDHQDQQYGIDQFQVMRSARQSSAASAGFGILLGVGALLMLPFMFSDTPQYQQPEGSASLVWKNPFTGEVISFYKFSDMRVNWIKQRVEELMELNHDREFSEAKAWDWAQRDVESLFPLPDGYDWSHYLKYGYS